MATSNTTISRLRQRFIDDMSLRKLAPKTQSGYIRAVKNLARFLGRSPYTATPEDLRRFQLQMVADGVSRITLKPRSRPYVFL
ncbi:MAG: phage integrase N-terminal SAM-like domain-containing protein [Amphritea sp.]